MTERALIAADAAVDFEWLKARTGAAFIETAEDGMIAFPGVGQTELDAAIAAYVPPPRLTDAAQAKAELAAGIDAILKAVVGEVPEHEKLSWPVKEAAARRVLADGTAALFEDRAMLATEMQLLGQSDIDAVARRIVAKADQWRALVAAASGIRQAAEKEIEAAADGHAMEAAVDGALKRLAALSDSDR
jgi:hypothetical protein